MYHTHYSGSHYEMGFRWGTILKKHHRFILDNVPFKITQERIEFALSCVPHYKTFFSDILDEIQGLADGQEMSFEKLIGILFSMYAIPPQSQSHCSVFLISDKDNILLCRNSDFLTDIKDLNMNVIYRFNNSVSYSFTGNTTAFIEMEDGVNQYGLAVGFTSVYPHKHKAGINAGMLVRMLLEKCRTTKECVELIKVIPIASSQTISVIDPTGDAAVIECNCEKLSVKSEGILCAVNNFHLKDMKFYNRNDIDTWNSEERYKTMASVLSSEMVDLSSAKMILSGKNGFMCQYDRKTGKDTVWSVIYDIRNKKIYRTEGNPIRHMYQEDSRFIQNIAW